MNISTAYKKIKVACSIENYMVSIKLKMRFLANQVS